MIPSNVGTWHTPANDTILFESADRLKTPLLENILSQPAALQGTLDYQLTNGRSALARCAELMRTHKRIVVTGMGASLFACGPMRYRLAENGVIIEIIETAEILYSLQPLLDAETLLVLVSRSGESIETVRLLDQVRCTTIGITNVPDSTLAKKTNEQIFLNSPSDQLVAVQTYVATVQALLLLAAEYLNNLDAAANELSSAHQLLPEWIEESVAASERWQPFIESGPGLYLLGRGPSLASADEGCLLMHEVAKTPSTSMSIAQFRHGFVEAADANVRAIVLGTYSKSSQIDRQFAIDLQKMGGIVRWIGPEPDSLNSLANWSERISARCTWFFEIVPLQMLAYRSAETRGIVPGTFRWASTVTASESGFPGLDANSPSAK